MSKSTAVSDRVDQNELRIMQACVMLVLALGYVVDRWELVALQVGIFSLTVLNPVLNPFIFLYRFILRRLEIVRPDWRVDNMRPHRFASMIGLTVSAAAVYSLYTGYALIGWGLVWLILVFGVFALSGWCAGCFTYYMINKIGIKGFFRYAPVPGVFPGTRPPRTP